MKNYSFVFYFFPSLKVSVGKLLQSGRFGKLNKKVAFPETLDLSPYMSEAGDRKDVYRLYAVVVHVDMLNASFFGHYICYIKDFSGNWYRIDDCKVGPFLSFHSQTDRHIKCLFSLHKYSCSCIYNLLCA